MASPEISIVTAITPERGLAPDGNGRAEWFMPEDLDRFRRITRGHAVVIAAVTFETILAALDRPLPNRTNIVVGAEYKLPEGVIDVPDFESGLAVAREYDSEEIFVMGNGAFYAEALPHVTKLYLTVVKDQPPTDEVFPEYDDFTRVSSEPGSSGGYQYDFQIFKRTEGVQ